MDLFGNKKILSIPSIKAGNHVVACNKQKAELFNRYFASHSQLPPGPDLPLLTYKTTSRLTHINLTKSHVLKVLTQLKISKATGPDGVGNFILKLAAPILANPLCHLFNVSLSRGIFPDIWKRAHVLPVFKKGDRQDKANYRPISLLPNISKVFERLVYKFLYEYLSENNLLCPKQSGFRQKDSSVCKLIHIVHTIYEALENGKEVCAIFLDISKAFDKVWHEGLLFKLKQIGVGGPLLNWFQTYLVGRLQRVIIKGQESTWLPITAGVPQGSILGPLLFLIFINDLPQGIESNVDLFADDTSLLDIIDNPTSTSNKMNRDLEAIHDWALRWRVTFNPDKTVTMVFSTKVNKPIHPSLIFQGKILTQSCQHKHLGLTLSDNLSWNKHIDNLLTSASKKIGQLKRLKFKVTCDTLLTLYNTMVRSSLEYADVVWDGCPDYLSEKLETIQYAAAKICTGAMNGTSGQTIKSELGLPTLTSRRSLHRVTLLHKVLHEDFASYLKPLLPTSATASNYNLRNKDLLVLPTKAGITNRFANSFVHASIKIWNSLPLEIRRIEKTNSFKSALSNYYAFQPPAKAPKYYASGLRPASVLQSRLRYRFSALNAHLYTHNIVADPSCSCGHDWEDEIHFFAICPKYAALRVVMIDQLDSYLTNVNYMSPEQLCSLLLYGSSTFSEVTNSLIFVAAQNFIVSSERFRIPGF